jgi:salicylate hydroxylase
VGTPVLIMTSTTTILVIGAGIAGPVLALFLKNRGYDPIIFEAQPKLNDAGLSLM